MKKAPLQPTPINLLERGELGARRRYCFSKTVWGVRTFSDGFVLLATGAFFGEDLVRLLAYGAGFWSFFPVVTLADTGFTCAGAALPWVFGELACGRWAGFALLLASLWWRQNAAFARWLWCSWVFVSLLAFPPSRPMPMRWGTCDLHQKLALLDPIRYNVGAFDLAAPCNKQSRTCVTCLQKFSENSARFQHKGNKALPWKQEQ